MKYIFNKNKNCEDCLDCYEKILANIENKFNCKLHAENRNDTVNGYIGILHEKNNHKITIEFYEKNETRNNLPTLKKLYNIPTESELKKVI